MCSHAGRKCTALNAISKETQVFFFSHYYMYIYTTYIYRYVHIYAYGGLVGGRPFGSNPAEVQGPETIYKVVSLR